jgi:hypothetical protein
MNAWTPKEEERLRLEWPKQGIKCAPMFPRHVTGAVKAKAKKLGLTSQRKYTDPLSKVILPTRSCGSGQIAPPTYLAQLRHGRG